MMIVGRSTLRSRSARLACFWLAPALAVTFSIGVAAQQNTPQQNLPENPPQPPGSTTLPETSERLPARSQASDGGPVEAEQTLLSQATYWRTNQTSQAVNSLDRLLQLDPGNADALAMLVQIDIDQDLPGQAAAALKRLQAAHPQDSRIPACSKSSRMARPIQKPSGKPGAWRRRATSRAPSTPTAGRSRAAPRRPTSPSSTT